VRMVRGVPGGWAGKNTSAADRACPVAGAAASPSAAQAATATATSVASPAASPVAAACAIEIRDFAFHPDQTEIAVGTTVTWTNNDTTAHTVTADDGSFDSGPLDPGKSFSHTFDKAGTFAYHCKIHPSMKA